MPTRTPGSRCAPPRARAGSRSSTARAASSTTAPAFCAVTRPRRCGAGEAGPPESAALPAPRRLTARGRFHLQATVRVLQRRPVNRVDVWDEYRYLRVVPVEGGHVLAAVTNRGTVSSPDIRFSLLAAYQGNGGHSRQVGLALGAILGLEVDPAPLR